MIDEPPPPAPLNIDPGEVWLAVIGVGPVLSKRVEEITDAQHGAVKTFETRLRRRAKSLLVGTALNGPALQLVNYERCLQDLAPSDDEERRVDMDVPQVQAMIRELPPDDQLPFMTIAGRAFVALQAALPRSTWTTIAGPERLRPDTAALLDFSDLYAALDDPIVFLFGSMADGSMRAELVDPFTAVYPTLAKAIGAAILDAVADRRRVNKSYVLPSKVEIGFGAWMGIPVEVSPPAPAPAPPPPPSKQNEKREDDALTPSEKIDRA